jgi:hypothetical protein
MPVPPRDRLRDILEEIRTHSEQEHLREWLRIVSRSRRSNHSMGLYGQIFAVHHYWSVLEQRHPQSLAGNVSRIQHAFAAFLHVSPEAIDKYRRRIRARLAPNADHV